MKSWVLAAGLLAAALPTGTMAADLDDGPPPPPPRYGAYDDHRYTDIYRHPPRPRPPVVREEYEEEEYAPPRRYGHGPYRRLAGHCVPREEVRHRLMERGWHDFHGAEPMGDLASIRARRPSGRLFAITLDRCSGEIVDARPLEPRPFGPYAYGPPRRWDRPY
jgi:hypothetical protein